MTTTLILRLQKQKSFFLTAFALLITTGFFFLSTVLFRASRVFVRWCADYIFAGISGSLPVKIMVVALFLLCAISVGRVIAFLIKEWRASKKLRVVWAHAEPLAHTRDIRVVHDRTPFAYTCGVVRPTIIVSSGLLDSYTKNEIRAVLQHETYHARHYHVAFGFAWELFCRAFFFLPLCRDVSRYFAIQREIRADAFAASTPDEKSSLASAMIKMLKTPSTSFLPVSVAGFGMINARAMALLHGDCTQNVSVALWRVIVSTAVFVLVMIGSVASLRPASASLGDAIGVCPSATAPIQTTNFSPYMRVQLLSSPYMVQSILLR